MRDKISIQIAGLVIAMAIVAGAGIAFSSNEATARLDPSPKELMEKGEVLTIQTEGLAVVRYDGRIFICDFGGNIRERTVAFGPCYESGYREGYE